jgi:anthranilate synthase/aminodeoxychorismate synthase-like glutamine amidotransferase
MILVIDNYDSFVHNLARQIRLLSHETLVVRNDRFSASEILAMNADAIVMSPGPCSPDQAGNCLELVRLGAGRVPMLGVCLGHQVICQAFGGDIVRAVRPVHGKASEIRHNQESVFTSLPSPLKVGRYHSLIVGPESLPDCLQKTAWLDDGTIMAVAHRQHCIVGVQFHPESILTTSGSEMLANFLTLAGLPAQRVESCELKLDSDDDARAAIETGAAR